MSSTPTLIFVYGTLKEGFANFEHKMAKYPNCELVTKSAKTLHPYPLMIVGERNVAYLFDRAGMGLQVEGEVYRVHDEDHLKELDIFEGCDTGHYNRLQLDIMLNGGDEIVKCGVYVRNSQDGDDELLKNGVMISCFTTEHDKMYTRASEHIG